MTTEQRNNAIPIECSTDEVKAYLSGKTQRREAIALPLDFNVESFGTAVDDKYSVIEARFEDYDTDEVIYIKPNHKVGDILFIQEDYISGVEFEGGSPKLDDDFNHIERIWYKIDKDLDSWNYEDEEIEDIPWLPAKDIPKEYARLFYKVTDIRVEMLQGISDEDCLKEGLEDTFIERCSCDTGVEPCDNCTKREYHLPDKFANLWSSTAPKGYKWEDNPYVIVETLERVEK